MEENQDFMENKDQIPQMKSLALTINKVVLDGYDQDFKVQEDGLHSLKTEKVYKSGDLKVVDCHRFEGASDPSDNSILYVIEAADGAKGTLIDAYGPYADAEVTEFMKNVEFVKNEHDAS